MHQGITWPNAGLLSIGPLGTNFSEIQIEIQNFSLMKMHLKMSSAKLAAILSRGDELSIVNVWKYANRASLFQQSSILFSILLQS